MSRAVGTTDHTGAPRRAAGAVVRRAALAALLLAPAVAATVGTVAAQEDDPVVAAADRTFSNPATITINDLGPASPYPSVIPVTGLGGSVTDVNVTLNMLTHTNPDDVDVLVVAPNGRAITLLSDAGGVDNVLDTTITFDDEAAAQLADSTLLRSGPARPTNFEGPDTYANPAPAPSGAALTEFDGIEPNGTWRLFVVDDTGDNAGRIAGGWSLRITTVNSRPVAKNDRFVTKEGERLTVRTPGLLKNDSDPDGDRLTARIGRQPSKGTVRISSNGSFTYTPKPNRTGRDTFTYRITDSSNTVSTATVTIIVKPARGGDD